MTREEVGALFKSARLKAKLTQVELGELVGKNQQHIALIEKGANATLETLTVIAEALGCELEIKLRKIK